MFKKYSVIPLGGITGISASEEFTTKKYLVNERNHNPKCPKSEVIDR